MTANSVMDSVGLAEHNLCQGSSKADQCNTMSGREKFYDDSA